MDWNLVCEKLLRDDVLIPTLITGAIVLVVAIKTIASTIRTSAKEKTRREIAAYIAEGTMSPEQGERLMRAGSKGEQSC